MIRRLLLSFRVAGDRPRLFGCMALGILAYLVMAQHWTRVTSALAAWNISMCVYLFLVALVIASSSSDSVRRRAAAQDEGGFVILALSAVASIVSIGAIVAQLSAVKASGDAGKLAHIALAMATIFTSWCFIHVMFALHYAHEYYSEKGKPVKDGGKICGGIDFPQDDAPDYKDFLYFSCAIGCSSATSDNNITSKPMRLIVLAHSVLSFFFNTTILALTINIAASLIS